MRCGPARPAFALALALTLAAVASCRSRPPAPEAPTAPGPAPTGAAVPDALPPPTPPSGWRLPAGVAPTAYRLALAVDPAADHFTGEVEIELAIAAPTRVIWLHAAALTIASASIVAGGATQPATIVDDAAHERIGVVVPTPLAAGPATVSLAYRGEVTDDDAVGVFRQEVEGRTYLFTQFQANYARRAAPCFDEPGWKTPWLVEVTAPAGLVVLGNTAAVRTELVDGRQVVGFAPTAPLPSYLVALAVGPFELVDVGPVGQAAVPTRIATPVGRAAEAAAAARFTPRAVAALEAYLGRPLPLTKLDLVAAPTLFGAMEHPGLVTFAAEILLEDPARPSFAGRRQLRQTVAHELAHQWFGNLVTPAWWDDLWLSEALASWLGERTARAVEGHDDALLDALTARERALAADARADAQPLRRRLVGGLDVDASFDATTYDKGAAILTMLERHLGASRFQGALGAYLAAHADGHARADDLVAALTAVDANAGATLAGFLDRPGAPTVAVELACDDQPAAVATVTSADPTRWTLPLCVRFPDGRAGWGEACGWLIDGAARLPLPSCPAWLVANPDGRGYFRVSYAPPLDAALRTHLTDVAIADRLTRALDLAAQVRAGVAPPDAVAPWIDGLLAQGARHDHYGAVELARVLADHVGPAERKRWQRWVRARFAGIAMRAGLRGRTDDTAAALTVRAHLLELVGVDGAEPGIGRLARARVEAWLRDGAAATDDRARLLPAAVAGAPSGLQARLAETLAVTGDREARAVLLDGLSRLRGAADRAANRALYLTGAVEPVDGLGLVTGGLGTDVDAETWRDLTAHYDAIAARLSTFARGELVAAAAARCSSEAAAEVEAFFTPRAAAEPRLAVELAPTLVAIRACAEERARIVPALATVLGR
ncbi:MAG: M1 family metallopeptidase [Kofleriaceae bacterium]|nr:M1 family metallopeptidase [Kofleriaceae bacterium]MBP9167952.1 M1 family metallopeptidase [Kofleriaceae bacterium]MBP9856786.1 M1 family metallopeptidase [Kofleriaceae bacterium]